MKISCIIPAFNEGSTIIDVIKSVKKVKVINEIIVVDDGSTDNTYKNAKSEGVKVIRHTQNKGKGVAIKNGVRMSSGEILIFLDADILNLNYNKISKMLELFESNKVDVVIGYYRFNCYQTFTELAYKPLITLLFPEVNLLIKKGHLSGERAFRREVLERINLKKGFDLEVAMNIELTYLNPRPKIKFVNLGDIKLRPKGYQESRGIIIESILDYARKLNRIERLTNSSLVKVSGLLSQKMKECIS